MAEDGNYGFTEGQARAMEALRSGRGQKMPSRRASAEPRPRLRAWMSR